MFQLHLTRWPCGCRWESGQGCLTPLLSWATQPPTLVSGPLPLLCVIPNQTPRGLTSRCAGTRRHPQRSTKAPFSEACGPLSPMGWGLASHHAPCQMGSCTFNSPGLALPHRTSVPLSAWRQNCSGSTQRALPPLMFCNSESKRLSAWMRQKGYHGQHLGPQKEEGEFKGAGLSLRVGQSDWVKQRPKEDFLLGSGVGLGSTSSSAPCWLCDLERVTLPL